MQSSASPVDLKKLKIICFHKVPPQHLVESFAGSRMPNKKEQQKMIEICEKSGVKFKKGRFDKTEDLQIKKNWEKFCKNHNWDLKKTEPFVSMRHGKTYFIVPKITNRLNFVRNLAENLDHRSLYSVYFRFRTLYSTEVVKGRYSKEEDALIRLILKDDKPDLASTAKWLGRSRLSVYQRSVILKKEDEEKNT